jgi:hypothetical protein
VDFRHDPVGQLLGLGVVRGWARRRLHDYVVCFLGFGRALASAIKAHALTAYFHAYGGVSGVSREYGRQEKKHT